MDAVKKLKSCNTHTGLLLGCLMLTGNLAGAQTNHWTEQNRHYVFGFDLGTTYSNYPHGAVSFPLGYSTFTYSAAHHTGHPTRLGASVRKRFDWLSVNEIQLGFSYHYITKALVSGDLAQGIAPPFSQFNYGYNYTSSQLTADAKIMRHWHKSFYPYVIASVGTAWNRAFKYVTSVPDFLTRTPYYQNKDKASLSYTVGGGIDVLKSDDFTIGLGYRFSDLGTIGLGNGHIGNIETPSQLKLSPVYVNTLLIEVNYFF
ncbi:outer membrane protein [Legionella sp. CNM-4043-24]|uniref:outer membrane protein n=1 Tax=Legionella sp. CNM-4043-24 TaxID=3421646 RepID=UPI00403B1D25